MLEVKGEVAYQERKRVWERAIQPGVPRQSLFGVAPTGSGSGCPLAPQVPRPDYRLMNGERRKIAFSSSRK